MMRRMIEGTGALLLLVSAGCCGWGAEPSEASYRGVGGARPQLANGALADASYAGAETAPPVTVAPAGQEGPPVPPVDPAPAAQVAENPFKAAQGDDATSTFAIDVDSASYALVRRYLRHHQLPPANVVRIEEMINTFTIADPAPPTDGSPFAARVEVAGCPWQPAHRLVRVSLRGRELAPEQRPVTNLVFLIDVSGSMQAEEKLPLLKAGMRLLVEQLGEKDTVAIAVYAGAAGLVLPPTTGADKGRILSAIDRLEAGGSTNGGAGIELAYRTAIEGFVEGGVNRVVLCTDGDWNVGVSSVDALERLIEEKRRTGVFLTCLGFGVYGGDQRMETLADKGNGHYAVIDDLREARRVLVDEMSGTLVTIAKDAKVQVEWNEARVRRYRLVGYENRVMANQDFTDDAKDGGELGAGHRVTALYEVEPADVVADPEATLLTLRLRWKEPDGETSSALELVGRDRGTSFDDATSDLKFVASVAAGGMLLRGSPHAGDATWARAIRWGSESLGKDTKGERAEWLDLLRRAARISNQPEVEQTPIGVNGTPGSNARG
jgi:Ca-activated chloride channel family protein